MIEARFNRNRRVAALLVSTATLTITLSACGSSRAIAPAAHSDSAAVAAAAANPVTISPLPGSRDASPQTQISLLGAVDAHVLSVSVVGSASGRHTGSLRAYATGTGESFLPSRPFRSGERVSVHVKVQSAGQTQSASSTFTIGHQASVSQREFPNNAGDARAVQHYRSAPTLTPSTLKVTTPAQLGAAPGDLFLAPYQGTGAPGPMIVDQQGKLVWFHPLPAHEVATSFGVQSYQGKPALVWWQGRVLGVGFGQGEDVIYDSSYHHLATVRAGNGYHADLHEIRLTPQGTAWIDIFDPIHTDLSSAHGARDGVLTDSVIQEIDIKTGLVMWEWHALDHIPLGDSFNPPTHSSYPWDYMHMNSADPGESGDVLLSARNSWSVYDVDIHSGAFRWRLGGPHSSFRGGPGTRFYWQHDAEFQPGGLISLFDNGSDPPKEKQSRGLVLKPDFAAHTVTLVKALVNPKKTLLAESQGNALSLPGGNWLLGYGRLPNLTEFDASGHVVLDATLGKNVQDFRSTLSPWSAQPTTAPSIAAERSGSGATVRVSWNGATGVAGWRVLVGASPTSLTPLASASKTDFETTIRLAQAPAYVQVQALDASGQVLGTSTAIRPSSGG
jgi:hypothetical protein